MTLRPVASNQSATLAFLATATFAFCAIMQASGAIVYGSNLVPNGDFESSDVVATASNGAVNGFVSDYLNIRNFWNLTSEGCYAIGDNPSGPYGNPYFPNGPEVSVFGGRVPSSGFTDHTVTGSGLMMIVNGASDTTKAVWQLASPISVEAGKVYRFEAWTSTFGLSGGSGEALASLRFEISLDAGSDWQGLGFTRSRAGDSSWLSTYVDGTFATSSNVLIRLMNAQPSAGGNDFAIDDIFFGEVTGASSPIAFTGSSADDVSPIPEPGQAAALLALLSLGICSSRRRD